MLNSTFDIKTAGLFSALGSPFRIRILIEIGAGEACVCHLESVLKKRQAYISQHLMALREAEILETRRDGKYVFYRLANPEILDFIRDASRLAGLDNLQLSSTIASAHVNHCDCPICRAKTANAE
jgi:ArsR family transcriptional regulator